jgi:hypothetical protein
LEFTVNIAICGSDYWDPLVCTEPYPVEIQDLNSLPTLNTTLFDEVKSEILPIKVSDLWEAFLEDEDSSNLQLTFEIGNVEDKDGDELEISYIIPGVFN